MNVYQMWEPETIVDEPARWEITLYARDDCPEGGKVLRQGAATADKWGLVTVEKLKLTGEKVRLSLRR